ncbi:HIRAN domain-containing protein [Carboxydothermus ferrireducens]|uniref:HIRAN domain-containing protein n=1 Tax=Carboxydothermus ferrireducens DSM 11255 TaxID=1119529 RepID=A0ABX2RBF7_9THEO|nr:HIRAN domain-containing protein [Carboxydothermus ferrireducens]NYE57207.1 hypothetical protein [Carboxydothermus ferrireducens DSM 11255]
MVVKEKEKELILVWKDPKTRLRYPVGRLWKENEEYYFKYLDEELKKAEKAGFFYYLPFTKKNQIYRSSKLFGSFASRLPDKKDITYKELLKRYKLDEKDVKDEFDLLRITGGILATDTFEFFEPIEFEEDGNFEIEFLVAGLRYYFDENLYNKIKIGDTVELRAELENEYDPHAVEVLYTGKKIGYVPVIYSSYIDTVVQKGNYKAEVIEKGHDWLGQKTLKIRMEGRAEQYIIKSLERSRKLETGT